MQQQKQHDYRLEQLGMLTDVKGQGTAGESVLDCGLVAGHAYSLLGVAQYEGTKLYKIAKEQYAEGQRTADETRLRWAALILQQAVRRGGSPASMPSPRASPGRCATSTLPSARARGTT